MSIPLQFASPYDCAILILALVRFNVVVVDVLNFLVIFVNVFDD